MKASSEVSGKEKAVLTDFEILQIGLGICSVLISFVQLFKNDNKK